MRAQSIARVIQSIEVNSKHMSSYKYSRQILTLGFIVYWPRNTLESIELSPKLLDLTQNAMYLNLWSYWFRQSNNNDNNDVEYDAGDDISDDNGENDENTSLCECYNTWRRACNEIDDDDELHENTTTSTKKHKNVGHSGQNNGTDSGCDSDCPENISELCKKFDENLSEQDVSWTKCRDSQFNRYKMLSYIIANITVFTVIPILQSYSFRIHLLHWILFYFPSLDKCRWKINQLLR